MSAGRVSAVVLGGGVTGLAIAHRLLARGCGRIDVTVLEVTTLVPRNPFPSEGLTGPAPQDA